MGAAQLFGRRDICCKKNLCYLSKSIRFETGIRHRQGRPPASRDLDFSSEAPIACILGTLDTYKYPRNVPSLTLNSLPFSPFFVYHLPSSQSPYISNQKSCLLDPEGHLRYGPPRTTSESHTSSMIPHTPLWTRLLTQSCMRVVSQSSRALAAVSVEPQQKSSQSASTFLIASFNPSPSNQGTHR